MKKQEPWYKTLWAPVAAFLVGALAVLVAISTRSFATKKEKKRRQDERGEALNTLLNSKEELKIVKMNKLQIQKELAEQQLAAAHREANASIEKAIDDNVLHPDDAAVSLLNSLKVADKKLR